MDSISVVIIAKDEENNIGRCIESVIKSLSSIESSEILLVDSASTDNTVKIAQKYPIIIIQIPEGTFVTPSAGRHIGFLNSNGQFIYFLDGDMVLDEHWFEVAMPILKENQKIAGVAGRCKEVFIYDDLSVIGGREDRFDVGNHISSVNSLGGSALYRASVLNNVGGFNPYLCSEEELELGFRIKDAGGELLRIPYEMTTHYTRYFYDSTLGRNSLKYIMRNLRTKRYVGSGHVLRLLSSNKMVGIYLKKYEKSIAFIVLCMLGVVSLIISVAFQD